MVELPMRFMSPEWADAVRGAVNSWPDDAERQNPLKKESYWAYVDRKRNGYRGTIAFRVRGGPDTPGRDDDACLVLTFDGGTCTGAGIRPADDASRSADLLLECAYPDWLDIVGGYDIGKAMTYHKLPLVVGDAMALLKVVYFVHEILLAASRVEAADIHPR